MIIDSHQHFWNYHPIKDKWIVSSMKILKNKMDGDQIGKFIVLYSEDKIYKKSDAVIKIFALLSSILLASSFDAKPPNTTE